MYNIWNIQSSWYSSYSETTGHSWFYSKDEATNFNINIENTNNFKSFKHKAKLLGNTVAQPAPNNANEVLRNAKLAVPLKCSSNFWRSVKIALIISKVEIKLKWTKNCVLSANGNDNESNNANNIIFTTKDTKVYVPVVI